MLNWLVFSMSRSICERLVLLRSYSCLILKIIGIWDRYYFVKVEINGVIIDLFILISFCVYFLLKNLYIYLVYLLNFILRMLESWYLCFYVIIESMIWKFKWFVWVYSWVFSFWDRYWAWLVERVRCFLGVNSFIVF